MNPRLPRERKGAVKDQKKSIVNYMKLDDENENKVNMIKRITMQDSKIDIEKIVNEMHNDKNKNEKEMLPKPPEHSGDVKQYRTPGSKLYINQSAAIINSFDQFETIDCELSLINLENYLSKFSEDELDQLCVKDILTFDMKELDKMQAKLEEFKLMGMKLNQDDIREFLEEKIKSIEWDKKNIRLLIQNFDKIEDFVILSETMKFFFKVKQNKNK
jgi:hypothetical protein